MTGPVAATRLKANDPCWCGSGKKFKRCHKVASDRVMPGRISPRRSVPDEIAAPPWAATGGTSNRREPHVKSPDVIERMRRTGRSAGDLLALVGEAVAPGVTT